MAEGGKRQQPIHVNVSLNLINEGDSVKVDHVEKKTEVLAGVIENVNMNVPSEAEQVARGNVPDDSATPNSGDVEKQNRLMPGTVGRYESDIKPEEPLIGQLPRINLTASNLKGSFSIIRAHILAEKGAYGEAIDILKEILPISGTNTFTAMTLMAECYAQFRQRSNLNSISDSIKEWIRTSDVDYKTLIEIIEVEQDSHPIRAMILRGCLSGVIGKFFGPNERVSKIRWECSCEISQIIKKLAKTNRPICKVIGIPLITSCLEDLRRVSGVDNDTKVEMEALCLNDVGSIFRKVSETSKAIDHYQEGVKVMTSQFGSNASKYRVLGHLLNNIALANEDLGQFKKAEEFYLKSLEAKEKARNWPSEAAKQDKIGKTKTNLQIIRKKMKKRKIKQCKEK